MQIIKVAICDDDKMICDSIDIISSQVFEKYDIKTESVIFNDPNKLLEEFKKSKSFDLFFLDIEMPKLDGIGLAMKLKEVKEDIDVIFISNREDKVFDTFKAHPFSFVRKGNFKEDFDNSIQGYVAARKEDNLTIAIEAFNKTKTIQVKVSDIVYIESQRNHQYIHTISGEVIEVRSTMETFEKKLENLDIIRVHKVYMVNLKYISCINSNGVLLKNGFLAYISRNKIQETKAAYLRYLRKTGAILFE